MSEHFVPAPIGVKLCVIEPAVLIESDFTIGVENEHWHQSVDCQIFNYQVETLSVAFSVESHHCKLLIFIDMELVERLMILGSHEIIDFLYEVFDSLILQSEVLIIKLQIRNGEDCLLGKVLGTL